MYKILNVILFGITVLLSGCYFDATKKDELPTIIQTVTLIEGFPFSVELPQGVDRVLSDNSDIYYTVVNNTVNGITPNVNEDTSFFMQLPSNQAIEIRVLNKPYKKFNELTRNYAFANGNIAKYKQFLTDGNDIPLAPIGDQKVHYPVTVSKYAHDLYASYRATGDITVLDRFYINALWLRDNCIYTNYGFCSWRTEPEYAPYYTGTDWSSAMAQGQAISVMISAYALTKDLSYLKVAQDAISAFLYPAEVKGVKSSWGNDVWYEEYTSNNPAHVLNGFIFSMAGLYDAVDLLADESAKFAFDQGIIALKNKLDFYDVDFTSLYDVNDEQLRFANAKAKSLDGYHELHILQLAWLYQVTQEPKFLTMFTKFLANDVATFRTRKMKSGLSNRIESINTSYSVRPGTNGPTWLYDRIWTYGNYWSTNKNGTEIIFELNQINDSEGVKCIMMSSIDTKFFPKYFDVFSYSDGQWQLEIEREVVEQLKYTEYTWKYQGKESTARTYCFDKPIKTTDKFKIEVYIGNSNLIALKEIDVHFNRSKVEQELLAIYENWKPNP
ncbi:MAG: hypothetical protein COB35_10615 [Gammaproteobacteria bacterium]|nr:MAG: hypothetical protein COB35_10615 [Gammaproteobacteria bacterium]